MNPIHTHTFHLGKCRLCGAAEPQAKPDLTDEIQALKSQLDAMQTMTTIQFAILCAYGFVLWLTRH